jgi:uncharacterized protein (DUF1684 family)
MTLRKMTLAVLFVVSLAAAVEVPDAAYLKSFEKWKADLINNRKQNWLALVGLFWLKPGANTFGSASDNAIALPSGPAHAGVFTLQGDEVVVQMQTGVQAKIGGQLKNTAELQSDAAPATAGQNAGPTVIELESLRIHVIKRGERQGVRVKDLNSEAARKYAGPVFFPLDVSYRVIGTFAPSDGKRTMDIPNVLGDVTPSPIVGEVHFKLDGQDLTLTAFEGDQAEGLSFVISDLTSKTETYPGGRFLDTEPVVNGKVVLDFNRAYSPPCSVTPYATCPLAPKENRLNMALPVGEKYDHTHGHH